MHFLRIVVYMFIEIGTVVLQIGHVGMDALYMYVYVQTE